MWTDRLGDPALVIGPRPPWWPSDHEPATSRAGRRFATVAITDSASVADPRTRREVLHGAMAALVPAGVLIVVHDTPADVEAVLPGAVAFVESFDGGHGHVFVRTARYTVHDLVADARAELRRVTPAQLAAALSGPSPPLVIDTRTPTDRQRWGTIDGAQHVPRTVLEWRLDPANGFLHSSITSFDQPLVVVCNHGYSSSLSAANLVRLGYTDVADLDGGMAAWRAEGFPLVPPDHSFLEL